MVGHYAPGKNLHTLLLLATRKAINKYILILVACKNVNPFHYSKTYEVNPIRIVKLVVSAHKTNIAILFAHAAARVLSCGFCESKNFT